MRLARILVGAWLVLGGITACSDHNPTVVFTPDAGADAKSSEAGTPQDSGGSHDGGSAEVTVAVDGAGPLLDVSSAVDQAPEVNLVVDVASSQDTGVDRAADLAIDSSPATDTSRAIDGADSALDGPGGTPLDVGSDSSAVHDGGGTGG